MSATAGPLAGALSLDPDAGRGLVLAFVGAGGKTSAIFALVRELCALRIIVTTTTKLRDPRLEWDRPIDRVLIDAGLASPSARLSPDFSRMARAGEGALVLASGLEEGSGKIFGIDPSWIEALRGGCDLILVEADGSRGLPIKAPAAWEPVLPPGADLIVGLIGLDALGRELGPASAQRPEILGPLVGCAEGEALKPEHLLRLAASPEGLFKGAPPGARRALILNKAESLSPASLLRLMEELAEGLPGCLVLACSLHDGAGGVEVAALRSKAGVVAR